MKIYYPTMDLKFFHILFEMLSTNLRLDSRDLGYLRYRDLRIDKTRLWNFFSIDREAASAIASRSCQFHDKYADMRIFM